MGGQVPSAVGALVVALTCALMGCASDADLARPERRMLPLGSTRYDEVIARFGTPQRTAELVRNGARIQAIWYSYSGIQTEAVKQGEGPIRVLECDFADGVLVGRIFASTFKSDSTDFDESFARGIQKGTSTAGEVITLMGRPTAFFVPPLVKAPATMAVGYFFAPAAREMGSAGWTFRKNLIVTFDDKDVAYSVETSASQPE
jgi:hypothetical protein